MSGPKCAKVSPNQVRRLREQCEATVQLRRQWQSIPEADEVETLMVNTAALGKSLRKSLPAEPQTAERLKAFDARRQELSALHVQRRADLDRFHKAVAKLDNALSQAQGVAANGRTTENAIGTASTNLSKLQRDAQEAVVAAEDFTRQVNCGVRELELWSNQMRGVETGASRNQAMESLANLSKRLAREARLAELSGDLARHAETPQEGWDRVHLYLHDQSQVAALMQKCEQARSALAAGDVDKARGAVAQAANLRATILEEWGRNERQCQLNQEIADTIMQTLCENKYDAPLHGFVTPGDPLSGIQLRAAVPNRDGRGALRAELLPDGSFRFELANVPEGEEQLCRHMIESLATGLQDQGIEFEMTDWGRAKQQGVDPGKRVDLPRDREREIRRERE